VTQRDRIVDRSTEGDGAPPQVCCLGRRVSCEERLGERLQEIGVVKGVKPVGVLECPAELDDRLTM
jgi:hypothetical protein